MNKGKIWLFGHNLKIERKFYMELSRVSGIGLGSAKKLCGLYGVSLQAKVSAVNANILNKIIREIRKEILVERDLERVLTSGYKKELQIRSYKGLRYNLGLPVNGQRTKTNAKTAKKMLRGKAKRYN